VFDDTPWSNERDAGVEPVRNTGYEDIEDGSIVKVLGDVIVILHRGRLFTVRLGDRSMQRRSVVNAYNPSYTELGTWYQIYLAGRRVVTVGQTIGGDMPIGVFDVDTTGRLALRGSYVWGRSDTAAARMRVAAVADGKLVLYAEQPVRWRLADPLAVMPVLWHSRDPAGGAPGEIVPMSRRFYRTMGPRPAGGGSSLHSVAMCDLAAVPLRCESVHIVGPRTDQVDLAKTAAYAWLADRPRWGDPPANTDTSSERALLLRVPLDGSPPATLTVTGSPRSAFFEERGEYVNAMIRRRVGTALLRIPVRQFTSGSGKAASSLYRPIPAPASDGMFAAFVAQHLIYGTIRSGPDGKDVHTSLFIVSWLGGPITRLELPFEYYALHQMGENAAGGIVAGPRYFLTSVLLGRKPHISPPFAIDTSAGGLLPSGGFFYRSDGPSSGIAGLPVSPQAYPGIVDRLSPASVTFVTYDAGHFAAAGELVSTPPNTTEDGCRVSCWDWYGDARPIFAQGRIFALLGYELIEGQLRDGQIVETSRIDLAEGLVTP
jgi:hypothetical protein